MQNINDLFKYIKFENFIVDFTEIPITGGIKNRKTGKGTNSTDKVTTYKPEEIEGLKKGMKSLVDRINTVIETM
jgi:hypothetical protein